MTSSVAAIRLSGGAAGRGRSTRPDWTDLANPKAHALRALEDDRRAGGLGPGARSGARKSRLAVVNPGAIIGPVLSDDRSFSLQVIERLLKGMPGMPRLGFSFVDVRDVADLQIRAMTAPEAGGERFIAVAQFRWMSEVAEVLRDRLGGARQGPPADPERRRPGRWAVRPGLRSVVGELGKRADLSIGKGEGPLGWSPRPIQDTIADTGEPDPPRRCSGRMTPSRNLAAMPGGCLVTTPAEHEQRADPGRVLHETGRAHDVSERRGRGGRRWVHRSKPRHPPPVEAGTVPGQFTLIEQENGGVDAVSAAPSRPPAETFWFGSRGTRRSRRRAGSRGCSACRGRATGWGS